MAQALRRTVWLEPEEQQIPLNPTPQPRNRRGSAPRIRRASGAAILLTILMVAVVVLLVSAFINTRARIAQYEFERQAMTSRLHQLKTETAQLKLDIALQNNAAQIAQVAQQENMAYPTADRVQYIQLAVAPGASNSQVASAPQRSWMGQAGHLLISSLDNIFQRFGHGPGAPAYAQD